MNIAIVPRDSLSSPSLQQVTIPRRPRPSQRQTDAEEPQSQKLQHSEDSVIKVSDHDKLSARDVSRDLCILYGYEDAPY
jgi:hypothetical protein